MDNPDQPIPKKYPRGKKLSYKKQISRIDDHITDGKCGVRFIISWKNYLIKSKERSEFLMEEYPEGRRLLIQYIQELQRMNLKRFDFMVARQPDLAELLNIGPVLETLQGVHLEAASAAPPAASAEENEDQ